MDRKVVEQVGLQLREFESDRQVESGQSEFEVFVVRMENLRRRSEMEMKGRKVKIRFWMGFGSFCLLLFRIVIIRYYLL